MSALKTINPAGLYAAIHQALRSWHQIDARGLEPLEQFLVLRPYQIDRPTQSPLQKRQALNDFLADQIAVLSEHEPTHARVLTRRFVDEALILSVANELHVSEDQLNRLQREAIEQLCAMIAGQEQSLRAGHRERLQAGLPARPYTRLVGVDTLQQTIFERLVGSGRDQIITLVGLGGIGKTALADGVVRQVIDSFAFDEVLWLRVDQPQAHDRQADQAARLVFELAANLGLYDESGQASVAEFRRRLHHRPHLIVIDNLEEELASPHLLVHLAGLIGPSKFLLTSRLRPPLFPNLHVITVPELDETYAVELMAEQALGGGFPEAARALKENAASVLEITGGNPLALKLVVGLLDTLPLPTVLQALREGPGGDVEAMYRFVYQRAWQALEPESQQLLLAMPQAGQSGVRLSALQAMTGLQNGRLHGAVKQLITRSLIELRGSVMDPLYGIHQLTHTFLQTEIIRRL